MLCRRAFAVLTSFATLVTAPLAAHAVTIGVDARATISDFAAANGMDARDLDLQYGATGIIACSGVYSTGQLTLRSNVITTAAHAFFDESGRPRGNLDACTFTIDVGDSKVTVSVDGATIRAGSRSPYAEAPVKDWAVARLKQGVPGVRPYRIGGARGSTGTKVVMLAHRHQGWRYDGMKAIESCSIRTAAAIDSKDPRQFGIDCSAGQGASGSAIMLPGQACTMVGIYVGWRSKHPATAGAFSESHQNYGVAIEGGFRTAILAVAGGS